MGTTDLQLDTIYALSSGQPPSGVAVVRLSGPASRFVVETITESLPVPRVATLRNLKDGSGDIVDRGLVLWFPGPASFTGEDCAELHVHGGRAVVAAVLELFGGFEGMRLADPGEFSRRAFENGKLDLAEIEGLADLIGAQTDAQRRLALRQMSGSLSAATEDWRQRLSRIRAMIEANLDFSEEEDIPGDEAERAIAALRSLEAEIAAALKDDHRGEIVRNGLEVVLLGKPNAGKSSLLNALAKRDVAIVTEEAGTTRDLIEVQLDIGGYAVTLVDTAGLRQTESRVEQEGIERARRRAETADLFVWLVESGTRGDMPVFSRTDGTKVPGRSFVSKDDAGEFGEDGISIRRSDGLSGLLAWLEAQLPQIAQGSETVLITRRRHRDALQECLDHIGEAIRGAQSEELIAERLRDAAVALGRVTGRVDVEQLLDVIFSEFCVGK